jgi:hypothetical protein
MLDRGRDGGEAGTRELEIAPRCENPIGFSAGGTGQDRLFNVPPPIQVLRSNTPTLNPLRAI